MHTRLAALTALTASLVSFPGTLRAADSKLSMRLSQTVASAPAEMVVTATVEPGADNRALEVAAESQDFFRSSVVTLEGDHAPRTTQLRFKNLPSGEYVVVVVLHGSHGERTFERRSFLVMPSAGTR